MEVKVDILIPCHNAEAFLARAIESALNQTYSNKAVIVYDDGSTDKSAEIIRYFGDRIRFEKGPNRGANYARNRLLELSRGEWLQYLDADDYLLPNKIKRQTDCIASRGGADVIYSQTLVEIIEKGRILRKSAEEINPLKKEKDIFVNLARWRFPQTGSVLFAKDAILKVGGWKEKQPCCQEHELYLRLLTSGKKFVFCEDEGAVYRMVEDETLSRRNPLRVTKERMHLTDKLEEWLRSSGALNEMRQKAINIARFECARSAEKFDKKFANSLIKKIKQNNKNFIPKSNATPPAYCLIYRIFGFSIAEKLAEIKRAVIRK